MTTENHEEPTATRTQCREQASSGRDRVRKAAREDKRLRLNNLPHHLTVDLLRESYHDLNRRAVPGVDEVTWRQYGEGLEERLADLHARVQSGRYRAKPSRRIYIPKTDGRQRPIGIAALEDKIVQQAAGQVLGAIWEEDFANFSYGFRPGRSQHQALDALWVGITERRINWVLDADIRSFFDTLKHDVLRQILSRRVRDGVVVRLIGKWLNAGVLEDGAVKPAADGTPQGGVISPLLANVYLHEVVDEWFERTIEPLLGGEAFLVRYADDLVLGFAREEDARRVLAVLPKRLGKYGLSLHPEKTRLLDFRKPLPPSPDGGKGQEPGSFDFLGFTHYWAKSRFGKWVVKRKTSKSRLSRGLQAIALWCAKHRHGPVAEQHETLNRKLRGHCAYYGITGNSRSLQRFREGIVRTWREWLNRRSQRAGMGWGKFHKLLERYPIMPAMAMHSIYRRTANP